MDDSFIVAMFEVKVSDFCFGGFEVKYNQDTDCLF